MIDLLLVWSLLLCRLLWAVETPPSSAITGLLFLPQVWPWNGIPSPQLPIFMLTPKSFFKKILLNKHIEVKLIVVSVGKLTTVPEFSSVV